MADCCFPLAEFIRAKMADSFAVLLANFVEIVETVVGRMRVAEG